MCWSLTHPTRVKVLHGSQNLPPVRKKIIVVTLRTSSVSKWRVLVNVTTKGNHGEKKKTIFDIFDTSDTISNLFMQNNDRN